jgi:hypothetical protein
MVGVRADMDNSYRYVSKSVTLGQTYYIKVYPYGSSDNGDYQITFNTSYTRPDWTPPADVVTPLAVSVWTEGNIATSDEKQWFSFTATAPTQWIHVTFGTLDDFYVELYDRSGATEGIRTTMFDTTRSTSRTLLTSSRTYYIKVYPYGSGSGTYHIAFNTSMTPPTGP